MRDRYKSVVWLLILVALQAGLANAAESEQQPDYFPFAEGANWQLNFFAHGHPGFMSIRVASIQSLEGRQAAVLDTLVGSQVVASEAIGKSAEGVFRINFNGYVASPPLQILRYPVHSGDTWTSTATVAGQQVKVDSKVAIEKVTVPAGTFEAAVITSEGVTPDGKVHNKMWLAPGVGLVKQEAQIPGLGLVVAVLTHYEPGRQQ
jgi:hypothetical protein